MSPSSGEPERPAGTVLVRILATTGLYWGTTIGISLVSCAISIYVFGQSEEKFGGPADNFGQCVSLYGFGLGFVSAPLFAAAAWVLVRAHDGLFKRPWLLAVAGAILVSSYLLITLIFDVFRAIAS